MPHVDMGFGHATSRARTSWSKKVCIFQTRTYKQPFSLMTTQNKIDLKWCKGDCVTLNSIERNHSVHRLLLQLTCSLPHSSPSFHRGGPSSFLVHSTWDCLVGKLVFEIGFCTRTLVFPCQYYSPALRPHSSITDAI